MVLVYIYIYWLFDLNDWINIPYLEHLGHASNKHMAFVINVYRENPMKHDLRASHRKVQFLWLMGLSWTMNGVTYWLITGKGPQL